MMVKHTTNVFASFNNCWAEIFIAVDNYNIIVLHQQ